MQKAEVPRKAVADAIAAMRTDRILPYRFITAARYAPDFEPELESAMLKSIKGYARLPGRTRLLIDVSGSMFAALSAQIKKGLARALTKFDAYQLAKYDRDGAVRIRDVLFLVHAKPKDADQEKVWKQLVDGELVSPDTGRFRSRLARTRARPSSG